MKRRNFLKGSALISGLLTLNPVDIIARPKADVPHYAGKKAKNVIFMISDGMSSGTLAMADLYSRMVLGRNSNWMQLYLDGKMSR